MRSFLAPLLTMSSPFVGFPVDLGVCIVQGSLQRQRVFRDGSGPLALPENIHYERYRFSSEGIRYLMVLVGPYVDSAYCCAVCLVRGGYSGGSASVFLCVGLISQGMGV